MKHSLWEKQQLSQQEEAFPGPQGVTGDKSSQMIDLTKVRRIAKQESGHIKPEKGQ